MGIINMELPVCDVCKEVWLPQKGSARANPREDAERCGKCKNPNWDRNYRRINPKTPEELAASENEKVRPRKKCQHQLLECPICHKATP